MIDLFNEKLAKLLPKEKYSYLSREVSRYNLHPSISNAIEKYPVGDMKQLVLHWPHLSTEDPDLATIAYTRSVQDGNRDRQVRTTLGKYLRANFEIKDHEIRDLVGLADSAKYKIEIWNTTELIIKAVDEGPSSCMSKGWSKDEHPYSTYAPSLGWSIAVRIVKDEEGEDRIDGRALIYEYLETPKSLTPKKVFVRSYKRNLEDKGGYSYSDEILEAWLENQNIEKFESWPEGAKLEYFPLGSRKFVCPYIDGYTQNISIITAQDGTKLISIERDGDYEADDTEGVGGYSRYICDCDNCGDSIREDSEYYSVGQYEDITVCYDCYEYNYTYAYGSSGEQYYVHSNDIVTINGVHYHEDYLCDNGLIEINGSYYHEDDTIGDIYGDTILTEDSIEITHGEHEGGFLHKEAAYYIEDMVFTSEESYQEWCEENEIESIT